VRLGDARAEFRTRPPLEAVDFGAHVMRAHAWPIARAVLAYSLTPMLVMVGALVLVEEPGLALLLVFWLRPIDSRIALLVASRGLFGDVPSLRETGRLLVTTGRKRLLWDLTLGRFSLVRSVALPVALLEGVEGARRKTRMALVIRGLGGVAMAVAFGCFALELVLAGALTHLIEQAGELRQFVGPGSLESDLFAEPSAEAEAVRLTRMAFFYALAAPLGEVLYALSGFALYLNRRTLVEGWDVELAFRRLARRAGGAALLLCLCGAPRALADDAFTEAAPAPVASETALEPAASETEAAAPEVERARREIEAVLVRPEFGREVTRTSYEFRFQPTPEEPRDRSSGEGLALFGAIVEVFAWLVVALLVAGAVVLIVRALPFVRRPEGRPRPAGGEGVSVLHGELARRRGMGDIASRARRLAREGRALEALSLLYVGAIHGLVVRFPIELSSDATEGECLRAVRRSAPKDDAARFASVTRAWQLAAYKGELPTEPELGELIDLAAPLFAEAA
jgi:hypothetical protein